MRLASLGTAVIPLLGACIQSIHGDGPSGPPVPGGEVRLIEEQPGSGRLVGHGDRIRVDLVGKYSSGEVWGEGPLTLIVGPGSYRGAREPLRVGGRLRLQYVINPNDTAVRLVSFQGDDSKNEAYQLRRDRGQVIVEHTIRDVCRPLKVFFFQTGFGPIEARLGCWPIWRAAPRLSPAAQFEIEANSEVPRPDGTVIDPLVKPRPPVDPSQYLDDFGLHRAVQEGRPEIAGWLLARGGDVAQPDSFGFLPIHYLGWAQRPLERFVAALEQSYLDLVDTLVAHGAVIDAPVLPAGPEATRMQATEHQGQTALGLAAPECADRLVRRLLDRGAAPNPHARGGPPPLAVAAWNGCPETVALLLARGATVDFDPQRGGSPLERLVAVSAFHQGHLAAARLLVDAGARRETARERLAARLDDPGPGSFGFSNRPMARRILDLLMKS
jgi:hypothetical protein